MANEWYYTRNGQQVSTPVSAAQLKQLASAGQLQPGDLVWQQGMADWVPASSIKGLFGGGKPAETMAPIEKPATQNMRVPKVEKAPPAEGSTGEGIMGLHPVLVLVLSICTFGIFGLIYAFLVCQAYTAQASVREKDAGGRPLGRARHPLWVMVLSYLSFGFYFYYWIYMVMRECSAYTGRKDFNHRTEFCLMLLFPAYAIYLAVFRLPDMIRRVQATAKVPESFGLGVASNFFNPCLFCAIPYLGMVYQDALNQVWFSAP